MTISFIGAGKVGTSLGLYFQENNFNILGFYNRSFVSAQNPSDLTKTTTFKHLSQALGADIIFITVNDDAIKEVALDLFKLSTPYDNKIFVHTSGAHTASELEILKNETSSIISMHPIQAFTDIGHSVAQLKNTVFSLEGDPKGITALGNILSQCGNQYFTLTKEQKPLYHASACVVSNYLVTLLDYGFSMLEHIGLPKNLAQESFFPLIEATLNNVKTHGPTDALTGPISRGDITTIQKHLESFKVNSFAHTELYKALGRSTLGLAEKGKLKKKDIALEISQLLEAYNNEK